MFPFVVAINYLLLFSLAMQPTAGYGLLITRDFLITHYEVPQLVGIPLG
jgi:hypothetical protein